MNSLLSNLKNDPLYLVGMSLLAACTVVFCLPLPKQAFSFSFLAAYASFIGYFIAVAANNKRETGRYFKFFSLPHNLLLLLLGNLSAYALNLGIPVFEISTTWLCVFLVLLNVVLVTVGLRQIAQPGDANSPTLQLTKSFEPDAWNYFAVVVICAGMLFQAYQVIYTIPLMPVSLLAFWFFGISLHVFLPAWFLASLVLLLKKFLAASPTYWKSAIAGWALPVALLLGFILIWNHVGRSIEQVHHETLAPLSEEGLPEWAKVGQRLSGEDWMVKRILNSRMTNSFDMGLARAHFISEDGFREHDPFIAIAAIIARRGDLSETNLDRLQSALFNSRHKTEPRLWSGKDLRTRDIVTNVQLFPAHRLAYTEKTLLIENKHEWAENQQEAIYSFYLPEGSVVTSASLWIGDREEKAYLTTRQKADTAYQTIVGRERKDPMLVRWQEGNRVSLRVFPCTPKEKRKFKIGITSPLFFKENQGLLIYHNIDFDGCDKEGARETVQVLMEGEQRPVCTNITMKNKGGFYQSSGGGYKPDWKMSFKAPPLSEAPFSFNGRSFQMQPLVEKIEPAPFREVYLDINDGWKKSQFNNLWRRLKNKEVYAWSGGLVRLTEENKDDVFEELNRLNFSLFPFDKIRRPAESVVVTAGCGFAPVPGDLDTCLFARNLLAFFAGQEKPVRVLNLGEAISPYFKGLAETRSIQVHANDLENVIQLLESQQFPVWQEDAETVVLQNSAVKIKASSPHTADLIPHTSSPDHLLRLFAYNDLMKRLGKKYFNKKSVQDELVGYATEAYVVSPVSSLVSLERQEDYERFDIQPAGENSLKNASIKSSGAVPEPHEWVLLAVCFGAAMLMFWRKWS